MVENMRRQANSLSGSESSPIPPLEEIISFQYGNNIIGNMYLM